MAITPNPTWGTWVREKRECRHMTRSVLADNARTDPSYITVIERDGYVPRKDKVLDIAYALRVDEDEALLTAGYAPVHVPLDKVIAFVKAQKKDGLLIKEVNTDV